MRRSRRSATRCWLMPDLRPLTIGSAVILAIATPGCAARVGAPPPPLREGLAAAVGLGQRAAFGGGLAVTPLRIEEDSRCPLGVQCIQAGTVRLAVRIEEGAAARDAVLTLKQPLRLAGGSWLTLAAICPYPRQPGAIRPESYRFSFALGLAAPAPPLDFVCPSAV